MNELFYKIIDLITVAAMLTAIAATCLMVIK